MCIFWNHGSTVFGLHLSIRSFNKFSEVFCQVLWFGMLGVGCGEQWQVGSKQNNSGFAGRPWAQPVSLERHGHRNNKNSTYQIYEGRQVDTNLISWTLCIYLNEPRKTIATPNGSVVDAWLWIILSGKDFHPGPPCPPGHLPPQIEFAGVLRYT